MTVVRGRNKQQQRLLSMISLCQLLPYYYLIVTISLLSVPNFTQLSSLSSDGSSCASSSLMMMAEASWHAYDEEQVQRMKTTKNCHKHHRQKEIGGGETINMGDSVTTERRTRSRSRRQLESTSVESDEEQHSSSNSTTTTTEDESNPLDETCPCYHEATRPYTKDFIENLQLWPGLTNSFDEINGETLYGSRWALEEIHKNQNPPNCSEAKYLVTGGWPYGFGSRIHMEGVGLAMAMNLGRVYLPHPDGDNLFWETRVPFCQNIRHDTTLNCFYERYSKCTIQDAVKASKFARDVNSFRTYYPGDFAGSFLHEEDLKRFKEQLEGHVAINVVFTASTRGPATDGRTYIPHQMHSILQCSPMKPDFFYYWWRAVSATYITRPNRQYLIPYLETLTQQTNSFNNKQLFPTKEHYKDCIATFVRHGDKGIEMKLLEFDQYRDVAQAMWNGGLVPGAALLNSNNNNNNKNGQNKTSRMITANTRDAGSVGNSGGNSGGGGANGRKVRATRRQLPTTHQHHNHNNNKGNTGMKQHAAARSATTSTTTGTGSDHRITSEVGPHVTLQGQGSAGPQQGQDKPMGYNNINNMHFHNWTHIMQLPNNFRTKNGTLFITTEDPAVLEQAESWGKANHWSIAYTNLFDRAKQTAYKTWDEQHKRGSVAVHDNLEYISMILNLQYALQCEAWVCTIASNSCRIIDELRTTIGGKANRHYADLSKETCSDPPCILNHGQLTRVGE